jgi:hypothetical protein
MMAVGTALAQLLLPSLAWETGRLYPEVEHLVVPYSVAAVLMVVCIQAALVGVWMLVSAVSHGSLFDPRTVVFLDMIRIAAGLGAAIPAGVAIHLLFFVAIGGPGVLLGLAFVCVVGAAIQIFLTLVKTIYLRASEDHAELDAVI